MEEEIFEPEDNSFEVWARINEDGYITEVNSNVFITDYTGWTKIDEHIMGDKGAHAQSQYFDKPLMSENGKFNYKYINGKIVEN